MKIEIIKEPRNLGSATGRQGEARISEITEEEFDAMTGSELDSAIAAAIAEDDPNKVVVKSFDQYDGDGITIRFTLSYLY